MAVTTNKTISKDTELYTAGQALLDAAHVYWKLYRKELGTSAVVYLESDSGHLVIFTRGEYKGALMGVVSDIANDTTKEAFFS